MPGLAAEAGGISRHWLDIVNAMMEIVVPRSMFTCNREISDSDKSLEVHTALLRLDLLYTMSLTCAFRPTRQVRQLNIDVLLDMSIGTRAIRN